MIEDGQPSTLSLPIQENDAFILEVGHGEAMFRFKRTFPTLEAANAAVREYLRSWEADVLLQEGAPVRRDFPVTKSEIPGGPGRVYAYATVNVVDEGGTRRLTPWRRHRYWHHPLLQNLIQRYEGVRSGREQHTVVAYLCYTALAHDMTTGRSDRKDQLAKKLNMARKVMAKLTELASTVGTLRTARKIEARHQLRELTPVEAYWIETVLRLMLMRAGEVLDGHPAGYEIGLADLPHL